MIEKKSWKTKIVEIISSPRFQQLIIAGIILWLKTNDWKLAIIAVLSGSVVVSSADSVATRLNPSIDITKPKE